jgi:hypothetical protein
MRTALLLLSCLAIPNLALADPPKPLGELASAVAGTWKCTGTLADDDGKHVQNAKATIEIKLDGMWLQSTWTDGSGVVATSYTTYLANEQLFLRHMMLTDGDAAELWAASGAIASSPGMAWSGDLHIARARKAPIVPTGEPTAAQKREIEAVRADAARFARGMPIKQTEAVTKDGYTVRIDGSFDGGKTYVTLLSFGCKR